MSAADLLREAWPVLVAYLVGATPFGFLAGRLRGIDIREHGSGNIGATNVLRVLGKPIGITVLLLDLLKGLLPVLLAMGASERSLVHLAAALAAILGHNYTFWLGFKGGKGIATTAGAILPLMPWALLAGALVWLAAFFASRYVSVASIAAAVAVPSAFALQSWATGRWEPPILAFAVGVGALAVWKHRANIRRLRRGEENRFVPRPRPAKSEGASDPPPTVS